jgi:hypothetical protein
VHQQHTCTVWQFTSLTPCPECHSLPHTNERGIRGQQNERAAATGHPPHLGSQGSEKPGLARALAVARSSP